MDKTEVRSASADTQPIRPNKRGQFPLLATPFSGQVALGNGTQWYMQVIRSDDNMALHVPRHGITAFKTTRAITPKDVTKVFPKMESGDVKNMADFLNDQLFANIPRSGNYFADLTAP